MLEYNKLWRTKMNIWTKISAEFAQQMYRYLQDHQEQIIISSLVLREFLYSI